MVVGWAVEARHDGSAFVQAFLGLKVQKNKYIKNAGIKQGVGEEQPLIVMDHKSNYVFAGL